MGRGQGVGFRRHDRARGVEPQRPHARDPSLRDMAPGAHRRGARVRAHPARGDRRPRRREGRLGPLMAAADAAQVGALEAEAQRAVQAGRDEEAARHWMSILEVEPAHSRALMALGQRAFRRGDLEVARGYYERLVAADGAGPQQWVNLAVICQGLGDEAGEERALREALTRDPMELLALILRANLLERQGKRHQAAQAYGAVAAVAPPLERLHPDLRPAVSQALRFREQYAQDIAGFLDRSLESAYTKFDGEDLGRFRDSVDILVGRKRRFDS